MSFVFQKSHLQTLSKLGLAISLTICFAPLNAQAKGPQISTYNVGGTKVKLALPPNYCALNPKHPLDKQVIEAVKALVQARNILLVQFADCKEINDWHTGKLKYLQNIGSYQTSKRTLNMNLQGQEKNTIKMVCEIFKKQADQLYKDVTKEVNEKAKEVFKNVKVNEMKSLGVVHEDPSMCAAATYQKSLTEEKDIQEQVGAYSITFQKGKMLFSYLYAPPTDTIVKDLTNKLKKLHITNQTLNKSK